MNLLKLEHVSTGYGKKQVLFDISFIMQNNETVLLIGSNGSGKSTLLKTIYGLLKPWNKDARIWLKDENITFCEPSQLITKGIVYVPQQNELFEDLTVKENLELSGMQTMTKGKRNNRIDEILEQIPALKALLKQECNRLSGGERKLLSLAMALINQPKLIMLDEPLAGVSPGNMDIIIHHINNIRKSGISLILVEHRLKDIFDLADRVIGLKLGKVFEEDIENIVDTKKVML
ncbi:MAG: ATP-binding cassette domain-containing protein [Mariniphaga sp.]|nr:ATP-binding cassette domain-containing protein [Mariniphaga sp.]